MTASLPVPVESLRRGLQCLELVAAAGPEGMAFADIVSRVGLKRTTTHNLLKTLVLCGYARNDGDGTYAPGPRIWDLIRTRVAAGPPPAAVCRLFGDLAGEIGESVVLAGLSGGRRCVIARAEATHPVRVADSILDDIVPSIWSVVTGRVLVACADREERAAIIAAEGCPGDHWDAISSRSVLERELDRIRETGVAAEFTPEITSFAVPVLAASERLLAALGCHLPTYRCPADRTAEIIETMQRYGRAMGQQWSVACQPKLTGKESI